VSYNCIVPHGHLFAMFNFSEPPNVSISQCMFPKRDLEILQYLHRYRYLDTRHIFALVRSSNRKAYLAIKRLMLRGLIAKLPNNRFQRDRRGDPRVYELTKEGLAYLSQVGGLVPQATWLRPGNYKNPFHNLNLCLALASIELACREFPVDFFTWDQILAKAPEATQKLERPYVLNGLVPDALFSLALPDGYFACFALELDLTNHGAKEYKEKYQRYSDLIYSGWYRKHFDMKQRFYVLTITTNDHHQKMLYTCMPKKASPLFFKTMREYGSFERAPKPALSIFEDRWDCTDPDPTDKLWTEITDG
jgi:hypothetical protein